MPSGADLDLRKLAPDGRGLGILLSLLSVHLVKLATAGHEVHLIQANPLRSLEELPEEDKCHKDWQRDADENSQQRLRQRPRGLTMQR